MCIYGLSIHTKKKHNRFQLVTRSKHLPNKFMFACEHAKGINMQARASFVTPVFRRPSADAIHLRQCSPAAAAAQQRYIIKWGQQQSGQKFVLSEHAQRHTHRHKHTKTPLTFCAPLSSPGAGFGGRNDPKTVVVGVVVGVHVKPLEALVLCCSSTHVPRCHWRIGVFGSKRVCTQITWRTSNCPLSSFVCLRF